MNGILVVDKPADWTSHDVVAKLRGIFREKRMGHAGTLDPMATGVLVVFLGRATRAVELCENDEKEYEAVLRLGIVTDTQDITGKILEEHPVSAAEDQLLAVLRQFQGVQFQIPPMYSALKSGGRKLYDLARQGVEVERKPREITVSALQLLEWNGTEAKLRIHCSKGTYVRTLCHDIGAALGCGGCMAALRRTQAGRFSLAEAYSMEQILQARDAGTHALLVRPVDSLFSDRPMLTLSEQWTVRCKNGGEIPARGTADGEYRVYGPDGEFLMLGRVSQETLRTVKSFFEVRSS